MPPSNIPAPALPACLGPVLASLPPAALSSQPADTVLPFLSPILRQRVQLLSSSSTEGWIRLLCYDTAKAPRLAEIAQSALLEPHPVSGEIEVDWDYDAETRYRRVDEETLQALVVLEGIGLAFQLVYCVGDAEGDGWRVGEVSTVDTPSPFSSFGDAPSPEEADRQFRESSSQKPSVAPIDTQVPKQNAPAEDDADDGYWDRYDASPTKTPAPANGPSPAPGPTQNGGPAAEEDYYAQYDSVQPAMDNHDPDEEVGMPAPPLGLARPTNGGKNDEETELNETNGAWTLAEPKPSSSTNSGSGTDGQLEVVHPRPDSASSSRSVAKLEAAAENFGVQQHISRSIKSLFMLARASGIERHEFDRIVKTELDMLSLMED